MSASLTLYTRRDCHLCEHAAHILDVLGLPYEKVDITTDIALLEAYRERIPVLRSGNDELGWPFTADEAAQLAGSDP